MAAEKPLPQPLRLDAVELRDRIAGGALKAIEVAEACMTAIEAQEAEIGAWAHIDRAHVLDAARALDEYRSRGRPLGPLHGVPVAVADVIDTARMPTENGTGIDAGRRPGADAFVVRRLKGAGALIVGKTATTELAYRAPGKTRNPRNPAHTPGGSSSGSAAAVAAGMVPLSIGTQTLGSVIRSASFCGVVGFKPSFGAIPRSGVLAKAPSLDTVGVFAGSIAGAAMLGDCLYGYDAADPATSPMPAPRLAETVAAGAPVTPALAFVRQPAWDAADADLREGFAELVDALGDVCDVVDLPGHFAEATKLAELVQSAEMAKSYRPYERRGRDRLSPTMRQGLDEGGRILAHDYLAARDWPGLLNASLEAVFDRYDAIVTPAAPGAAPADLASIGSAAFTSLWSFCGTPTVSLPLLVASDGMPVGVQLVGRRGDDGRLLRTAQWLIDFLKEAE